MGLVIPNPAFAPGTPISSAEMNANFAAIDAAVDALEADVAALQNSPGRIVGMVRIDGNGPTSVTRSWMANGNTPTVTHTLGSGLYEITWPGESISTNLPTRAVLASVLFTNYYCNVSASGSSCRVRVYDQTGTLADPFALWVVLMAQTPP